MDPERYQMRDIKRRLDTLERARDRQLSNNERLKARLVVLEAKFTHIVTLVDPRK